MPENVRQRLRQDAVSQEGSGRSEVNSTENVVTVLIEKRKGFFGGYYRFTDEDDYTPLILDGQQKIPWDISVLNEIFRNLQIDLEGQPFRILLTSDKEMNPQWPSGQSTLHADWSLPLLRDAVIARDHVSEWIFNHVDVSGEAWDTLFPVCVSGKRRYVYTFPWYRPPESVKPENAAELLYGYLTQKSESGQVSPILPQPENDNVISILRSLILQTDTPPVIPQEPDSDVIDVLSDLLNNRD